MSTTCVICEHWEQTSYAKRYTTPTTAQDVEGAVVLGFWISQHLPEGIASRLCERHSQQMFLLDNMDMARKAAIVAPPTEQQLAFQERANQVVQQLSKVPQAPALPPLPPVDGLLPGAAPVPSPLAHTQSQPPQNSPLVPPTDTPAPTGQTFPCPICQQPAEPGKLHMCP